MSFSIYKFLSYNKKKYPKDFSSSINDILSYIAKKYPKDLRTWSEIMGIVQRVVEEDG